jgi:two-component system nitrate/nitrite response regulator NarL
MGETIVPSEILPFFSGHEEEMHNTREHSAGSSVWTFAGCPAMPHLSAQERRILNRLIAGECNKSIARRMDIAEATVKVHLKSIFCKINVHNRTQAVVWAMSNGWPCEDGLP